ncbi:MAG: ABC transporter permease [Spirosomaceae bacterium]|nr:ABC transporter permease [Spirosomataceae bacterium]
MIRSYLKIAFRNLVRNKVYSFINIAGLAMGICAFLLILEYVSLEKSVNQFHANLPNMYRVMIENPSGGSWSQIEPGWMAKAKERLPEMKDFCRYEQGTSQGIVKNEAKNITFREQNIGYVEGNFFDFFSFPLQSGNARNFNKPNVAFISETYSQKYFGNENPIGKTISLYNQFGKAPYTIEGVYADMGENSTIKYDIVFSLETLKNEANLNGNGWANLNNLDSQFINAIITLQEGADYKVFEKKFTALRRELQKEKDANVFRIQPFSEAHLAASFSDTLQHTGNIRYIYMLVGVAFLILLIAWFNYINLSTANALKRANEVGVRKVIGATQSNLVGQFLGESLLVNVLAFLGAILLIILLQPFFNQMIGKQLSLLSLSSSYVWTYGIGLLVVGSLGSGAYTALVLANYKPVETLKGKIAKTTKGIFLRKSLVVSQFSVSIALILFTILIYSQLRYMQQKDLGMNINQLLVVRGPDVGIDSTFKNRKNSFLNEISQQSFVKDYCTSGGVPSGWYNFMTEGITSPKSKTGDENKAFAFTIISDKFLGAYNIKLKAGRNFTAAECGVEWNDNSKVLVNERAIELLHLTPEEALNTKIKWDERYLDIVGVVKNYHHTSLQQAIDPMIFYPQNNSAYFTVRLTADKMSEKISSLEGLYKKYFTGNPFEYFFVDENFNKQYLSEKQYGELFTTASFWAIFIACLGLFGLATFRVESRTKEIGIRKVLGASVLSIVNLLSKEFLILVGIAILLASPVAYYFMDKWLSDFPYRINIGWWKRPNKLAIP